MHLIWLLFGLLGAIWIFWDTRKQGYSFNASCRWALGTLLVPAVVFPFYLLQSNFKKTNRARQHQAPRDVTANSFTKCTYCGNYYQGNPASCPHCRAKLKEG